MSLKPNLDRRPCSPGLSSGVRRGVALFLALSAALLSWQGCGGCGESAVQAPSVQSLLFRFPEAEVEASPDGPVEIHPVKVGGEERPSLYAPAPSRVRFRSVAIPRGAHLVFGIGLIDSTMLSRSPVRSLLTTRA